MRRFCVLLGTLIIAVLPSICWSFGVPPAWPNQQRAIAKCPPPMQGPFAGNPQVMGQPWPMYDPAMPVGQSGGLRPYVKLGSMWMSEETNFPFRAPDPLNPQFGFEQLTLTMNTEQFWVGFVGAEMEPIQNVILYGEIGANVPRNVDITMNGTGRYFLGPPDNEQNLLSPWVWTAKDVHWWVAEAGAAFMVTYGLGFELGFRTEHIDYKMTDPRNFVEATAVGIAAGLAPGLGISCARI